MRHLIEKLSPDTLTAYTRLRAVHDKIGTWPPAERVCQVADDCGGDRWAVLALTRGELPELDDRKQQTGKLVSYRRDPQYYTRRRVLAPTPETMVVLELYALDLYCDVHDPWLRKVDIRDLSRWAGQWIETRDSGRLYPPKVESVRWGEEARAEWIPN